MSNFEFSTEDTAEAEDEQVQESEKEDSESDEDTNTHADSNQVLEKIHDSGQGLG